MSREARRFSLQCTAELWQGLNVLDAELKAGQFASARETVEMLRAVVRMTDELLVEHLRDAQKAVEA